MKSCLNTFIKLLPFTIGMILVLTSLTLLTESAGDIEDDDYWAFVLLALIGIPAMLVGINMAANDNR